MRSKGFTAIEVIITLGIFAILMTTVMNAFMQGFASQKRIIEMNAVQRDGVYLMETLSREIRMASNTTGMSAPSAGGSTQLAFKDRNNNVISYQRANADGSPNATGNYFGVSNSGVNAAINSTDVKITNLVFYNSNTDGTGNLYTNSEPMITVSMTLQSVKDPGAKLTLQSTIAMRLYYLHS